MFTDGCTDARMGGRQAHRYIPQTLPSGDKKVAGVMVLILYSFMKISLMVFKL